MENEDFRAARGILNAILLSIAFWIIVVLMLWPSKCFPADPWSTADRITGSIALAATAADWSQTRYIARHPDYYRELNPTLPEHPSVGDVDAHFAAGIVLGAAIANWLPEDYRRYFLGGVAAIEIGVVAHNHSIGIKMRF